MEGVRGRNNRKYLAKSSTWTAPASKPAAPALGAKPRLKINAEHGFRVLVEASSTAALNALRAPIASLKPSLRRRIASVGSRATASDDEIIEMGRLAGRMFDHIIVHELPGTGGGRDGEASRLIVKGALQTGIRPSNIQVIADECESAFACLRFARSGDLVTLLMSDVDEGWRLVRDFRPRWKRPEEPGDF
jgi:cyanophycin synthetase